MNYVLNIAFFGGIYMQINITDIKTEDIFSYFHKRDENANKGSFGRALLIAGSYGMAGAAVICTNACVHSGVGIAHVVCPHSIYNIVSQSLPEAVFTPVNDVLTDDDKKAVIMAIKKADCVVIGCGMGMNDYTSPCSTLQSPTQNARLLLMRTE